MTDHTPPPCRTTQHCAYHGWCHRCDPAFAAVMSAVNRAVQRTDTDEAHWGPLYAAVGKALRPVVAVPVLPPADHTPDRDALRDRFADAIWDRCNIEGVSPRLVVDDPRNIADAVLAVLPLTDRASLLRAADIVEAMNEGCGQAKPCTSCDARSDAADALRDSARRMADEEQPATETHRCGNCEGVDPSTCLMNPDRPKLPPMDPVHILGIDAPAVVAEQPATETRQPDEYEQTTGHLITCFAVAGGNPDPDCPCTAVVAEQPAAADTDEEQHRG
ncbi:hypothetical protein [Streptomyces sp. NPDC053367]|uniref:hypothetical protein n=1 Tax=Streptomyces sp. NPDC053367 TaxID=3365700 RepID=UPI0037D2A68D